MAIKANMTIDQGSDFITTLTVTDTYDNIIDLTGFTGAASMKQHYTSVSSYDFTVTINPALGEVTLYLSSAVSNTIPAGLYVYDCELTNSGGMKSRIVEGIITLTPQVTN